MQSLTLDEREQRADVGACLGRRRTTRCRRPPFGVRIQSHTLDIGFQPGKPGTAQRRTCPPNKLPSRAHVVLPTNAPQAQASEVGESKSAVPRQPAKK